MPWRFALSRFVADERGTTITEYGLIIALMSLAIIGAAAGGFLNIESKFREVAVVIEKG